MIDKRRHDVYILAQALLGQVEDVIHQPYGHAGLTFEVQCARTSGDYIVKTRHESGSFDHTEHHIQVLKNLDIPVLTVLKRGTYNDFEYMLLEKIPGVDLGNGLGEMTRSQMTKLAEQIVEIERKVTSLPKGTGFGWTPMEVAGSFLSWTVVIERDSQTAPEEVRKLVASWKGYFDAVEPVCFLDDLTVKNVIIQNGEFQGIVDLDFVCYGDPLYWLSLAEVTIILDVGKQVSFYGDELRRLWGMTDEATAVCNLYNVIQAWFFLSKDSSNEALAEWAASRLGSVTEL